MIDEYRADITEDILQQAVLYVLEKEMAAIPSDNEVKEMFKLTDDHKDRMFERLMQNYA